MILAEFSQNLAKQYVLSFSCVALIVMVWWLPENIDILTYCLMMIIEGWSLLLKPYGGAVYMVPGNLTLGGGA